jgi:hypothetical protein
MARELPKLILALALVLLGFVPSGTALAQRSVGPGHFYGGRVHFGFYLGVPIYGPAYYPPYYSPYYPPPYYYPPAAVVPYLPPVYTEQGNALPAPMQAQGDWYYCAASKAYYPYVRECPAGWQRVPAQPPAR